MPSPLSLKGSVWVAVLGVLFFCFGLSSVVYSADDFSSVDVLNPGNPDATGSGDFPSTTQNQGFFSPLGEPDGDDPDAGTGSTTSSGTSSGTTSGSSSSSTSGSTGGSGGSGGGSGETLSLGLLNSDSGSGSVGPVERSDSTGSPDRVFLNAVDPFTGSSTSSFNATGAGPVIHNPEIPAGVLPILMSALSGMVFWLRSFFSNK